MRTGCTVRFAEVVTCFVAMVMPPRVGKVGTRRGAHNVGGRQSDEDDSARRMEAAATAIPPPAGPVCGAACHDVFVERQSGEAPAHAAVVARNVATARACATERWRAIKSRKWRALRFA